MKTRLVPVSSICEIILSGTPKTSVPEYWNGNINWATAKDVANCSERFIKDTEKTISELGVKNSAAKILPKDSIIISARGTVGKICITPRKMSCNQSCYGLIPKKHIIRPLYLYYSLRNLQYSQVVYGTIFDTITTKTFDELTLTIPELTTQDKILQYISKLDDLIECKQQENKILEKIAQTIFKSWFVDFEFPNDEGKPYKSSGGEMVYSEELEKDMPQGWRIGFFSDLVNNIKISLKSGEHLQDRKYIPIDLLPMHKIGLEDYREYTDAKSSLIAFEKDDILFGAMRPYFHRVNIAPFSGITRTTVFVLRPRKREYLCYALFYLNLNSSIDYANAHSTGSTIPYAVWNNSLEVMPTLLPDEKQLSKFNNLIYPLIDKIKKSFFELQSLSKIRDSLLPKLMSGEIRV